MRKLLRRLRSEAGVIKLTALLIPLSIAPVAAVTPVVKDEYHAFVARFQPRAPITAPKLKLDPVELSKWKPLPEYDGAVPVLLYHGINNSHDHYSVTPKQFAEQMMMLKRANFRTISVDQYLRFLKGDRKGLPIRPILITFDSGRWDSYQNADSVLAKYGYRATMSVIAGEVGHGPFYPDWNEVRRMRDSGRWDIALEAGLGATNIRAGKKDDRRPFYANLRVFADGHRESFEAYRHRVTSDIQMGISLLRSQLPGWEPQVMALPFGDYGQVNPNDAQTGAFLRGWLHSHFKALLLQGQPVFSITGMQEIDRYQVISRTTVDQLYTWLRHGLSYSAWTAREKRLHEAVVLQPYRDKLSQQLQQCAGRSHKSRKYKSCQRKAAIDRRALSAKQAELRTSADLALEVSS
jgi:Polysaccharide deacetylase